MASVIIVDYNTIEQTLKYIKHVNDHIINCTPLHYIIVDNYEHRDSSDYLIKQASSHTERMIADKQLDIFVIDNIEIVYYFANENLGYARGNNAGTIISDKLYRDQYYIISNNDLLFLETCDWLKIKELYETNPQICVIGPSIIGNDNKHQSPNRRINPFRTLILDYLVFTPFKKQSDLDYTSCSKLCFRVSGCLMIIRADLFAEIDRFDSGTFLYCEEMILSERLVKKGYLTYYCDDIKLLHNHGQTIQSNSSFIRSETWMHDSYKYYFSKYRNTNKIIISLSDICFKLYSVRRTLSSTISRIIHRK